MALFLVSPNPRWRLGRHLGKFKWRYLGGTSSDLLRVWFYGGVFGVSGSNGEGRSRVSKASGIIIIIIIIVIL